MRLLKKALALGLLIAIFTQCFFTGQFESQSEGLSASNTVSPSPTPSLTLHKFKYISVEYSLLGEIIFMGN